MNKLSAKYDEYDYSEESSSESIDENQVLGPKEEFQDFLITYDKIKSHHPDIYDKNKQFYSGLD